LRFTGEVLRSFLHRLRPRPAAKIEPLLIGAHTLPVKIARHPRARRYRLRLLEDGTARVTIPQGGNLSDARAFVERCRPWLEQQLQRLHSGPRRPLSWPVGTEILSRGELVRIEAVAANQIRIGDEIIFAAGAGADYRPFIERHWRRRAEQELPSRVQDLAAQNGFTVNRVSVRNQKSRWGSCSRRGTISLNWRLIQMPAHVSDYIILHELAHLRHMNHSSRFWQEVERLCPDYRVAERWLKVHRHWLR
jgi:predicted metal-dependent hydrolase